MARSIMIEHSLYSLVPSSEVYLRSLGFVVAALVGAVISSLASMLNSASTVATIDLYGWLNPNVKPEKQVKVGKLLVLVFACIAAFTAPFLGNPALGGIFKVLQEFGGFISPAVFRAISSSFHVS